MFDNRHDEPYFEPPRTVVQHTANSLTDGVVVPGLQAAITGALVGLAALAVAAWLQWPFWAVGGTAAALATLGAWLSYRGRWAWLMERMLGVDINGDQVIGQPAEPDPEPEPLRVIVDRTEDGSRITDYIDLPVDRERAGVFARALLDGNRGFSLTAWTGRGALFSRREYDELVTTFIARNLATWRNPAAHAQGVELTAAGRAVMRGLAEPVPLPPPHDRK
jgi:hypothetical protein